MHMSSECQMMESNCAECGIKYRVIEKNDHNCVEELLDVLSKLKNKEF